MHKLNLATFILTIPKTGLFYPCPSPNYFSTQQCSLSTLAEVVPTGNKPKNNVSNSKNPNNNFKIQINSILK